MLVFNSNASVRIGLALPFCGKAIFGAEQFADRHTAKTGVASSGRQWVRGWRAFRQVNGILLPIRYLGTEL
jgi:hypothetical protein